MSLWVAKLSTTKSLIFGSPVDPGVIPWGCPWPPPRVIGFTTAMGATTGRSMCTWASCVFP